MFRDPKTNIKPLTRPESIEKFINAGGLLSAIFFIPVDEIESYSIDQPNGTITLNPKQDSDFYKLEIADFTGVYSFSSERTPNGVKFRQQIEFEIPKIEVGLNQFIWSLRNEELIIKMVDRNGNTFVMNSPEFPAMLESVTGTTGNTTGKNGTQWLVSAEMNSTIFI